MLEYELLTKHLNEGMYSENVRIQKTSYQFFEVLLEQL